MSPGPSVYPLHMAKDPGPRTGTPEPRRAFLVSKEGLALRAMSSVNMALLALGYSSGFGEAPAIVPLPVRDQIVA